MPATAFKCPRFSATKITATGAIITIASMLKVGVVIVGKPSQGALARPLKSTGLPKPSRLVITA